MDHSQAQGHEQDGKPRQRPAGLQRIYRVLVVDDHPMVREGIKSCLRERLDLEISGEAESVEQALEALRVSEPDLVIVDLALRDTSGLELVKCLHEQHPHTKVIVHSMYDGLIYAERSLRAGAQAYVDNQIEPCELLKAITQVLAGDIYVSQAAARRLLKRKVQVRGEIGLEVDLLTDRELEVFRLIGLGVPTSEISARLHISRHTIDSHREKIKNKLGLSTGTELSRCAYQWVIENG